MTCRMQIQITAPSNSAADALFSKITHYITTQDARFAITLFSSKPDGKAQEETTTPEPVVASAPTPTGTGSSGHKPNCDHKRGTWCACKKFSGKKHDPESQINGGLEFDFAPTDYDHDDPNFDYVGNPT